MDKSKEDKEQFIKTLKAIIELENPNIADRVYRMTMARMKLYTSENAQDALISMIRYLVRTHPDPQSIFEYAVEVSEEYRNEMVWIQTVMENEINNRYLNVQKDRK